MFVYKYLSPRFASHRPLSLSPSLSEHNPAFLEREDVANNNEPTSNNYPLHSNALHPYIYTNRGVTIRMAMQSFAMKGQNRARELLRLCRGLSLVAEKEAIAHEIESPIPKMPRFDYAPPPYNGPSAAEILQKRKKFLSPSMFYFYNDTPVSRLSLNQILFFFFMYIHFANSKPKIERIGLFFLIKKIIERIFFCYQYLNKRRFFYGPL